MNNNISGVKNTTTIIDILSKGNLELFHSAFLAWLMDKKSNEHKLGNVFLKKLLNQISSSETISKTNLEIDYDVYTEYIEKGPRFDILVKSKQKDFIPDRKGIVFENKVKSFGYEAQLDKYKDLGYEVIVLSFLPETIGDKIKNNSNYKIIDYANIRDTLKTLELSDSNNYHNFIRDYIKFLDDRLLVFDNLRDYINSNINFDTFRTSISTVMPYRKLLDNDIRTFNYFYYYNFDKYLMRNCPELVFGTLEDYDKAEKSNQNTCWMYEKNTRGVPYMEAILFNPTLPSKYRLHDKLIKEYDINKFVLAPRIELWLDLKELSNNIDTINTEAGEIMIGTWKNDILKNMLRTILPYKNSLRRKKRARRNDHYEEITCREIPFKNLAKRIKEMLCLIGNFV